MKKIALTGLLIFGLMLSGCMGTSEKVETVQVEQTPVVLNIMHRSPADPEKNDFGTILGNMFQDFESKNPDIKINVDTVPSSMYESQLTVRLAADRGPDIYIYWPGGRVESQIRKGDIMEMGHVWKANGLAEAFKPGIVSGSIHTDGKIYSLPLEYKPNTFWYNKKIFDELGLDEPDSWDSLISTAEACKQAGYVPFAVGGDLTRWMPAFWFDYILLNTAGGRFREDLMWGNESWESEEVLKTFRTWKVLLDEGYFNENFDSADSKEAIRMVGKGEAVMMLQGPWTINELKLVGQVPGVDFGTFPFPRINEEEPQAAQGAIVAWCANPATKETEAVDRFMAYMASHEAMEFLAVERNTLSPRKDIGFEIYAEDTRAMMEELSDVVNESTLYMNFELATLPPIQDAGMDAFIDFMKEPESYEEICAALEKVSRETFDRE